MGILVAFISGILFLSVDALIEIYYDLKVQQISKNWIPYGINLSLNFMKVHVLLRIGLRMNCLLC